MEKLNLIKEKVFCNKNRLGVLISIALFVLFYGFVMHYVWDNGINLINSDASSEMVLAEHLNQEGGFLLSENWFYSSELRVLNTQIVYRLALMISSDNWHLARTISVGIFLLLLALSAVWLMCALGYRRYAFWAAIAIIAPFGRWYGWNVIFNSYYVPHIIISIVSIALVFCIMKSENAVKKRKVLIYGILLLLLGFAAGLGGIRQLMICYIPFFATGILFIAIKKIWGLSACHSATTVFLATFTVCAASGAGYLVNLKILPKYFTYLSYSNTRWTSFNLGDVLNCISDLCRLFGWQDEVNVFSLAGITNVFCLFLVIAVIVSVYCLLARANSLNEYELFFLLFFCMAFFADLLIFSCTNAYNESYWVPLLPFAFIPIFIFIRKYGGNYDVSFLSCYGGILLLLIISTTKSPYISWVPNNLAIQNVSQWLNETDYTEGLATFWNANLITEMSDGQIEMWDVKIDGQNLTANHWLQSKEHENFPEEKVFLLITRKEYNNNDYFAAQLSDQMVYEDDEFFVYDFTDIGQYFSLFSE